MVAGSLTIPALEHLLAVLFIGWVFEPRRPCSQKSWQVSSFKAPHGLCKYHIANNGGRGTAQTVAEVYGVGLGRNRASSKSRSLFVRHPQYIRGWNRTGTQNDFHNLPAWTGGRH